MMVRGIKVSKPVWVCNGCGTDFDNENDYIGHTEEGCDEAN